MARFALPTALALTVALAAPAAACIIELHWEVDEIVHDLPACVTTSPPERDDDEWIILQNDCEDPLDLEAEHQIDYWDGSMSIAPGVTTTANLDKPFHPREGARATSRIAWTMGDESGEIVVQQHSDPYDPDEICGLCSTTVGALPSHHGAGWMFAGLLAVGLVRRRGRA